MHVINNTKKKNVSSLKISIPFYILKPKYMCGVSLVPFNNKAYKTSYIYFYFFLRKRV